MALEVTKSRQGSIFWAFDPVFFLYISFYIYPYILHLLSLSSPFLFYPSMSSLLVSSVLLSIASVIPVEGSPVKKVKRVTEFANASSAADASKTSGMFCPLVPRLFSFFLLLWNITIREDYLLNE